MSFINEVSKNISIPSGELSRYAKTCPRRYKVYYIRKRNGKGLREIAQPAAPVKKLQREALEVLKPVLPIHDSAMAYREGRSIVDNADRHKSNPYILKMDFRNFFPSIRPEDFISVLEKNVGEVDSTDLNFFTNLFFRSVNENLGYRLSIGAPSSPFISNCIMFEFDSAMSKECERLNVTYTRYADDLTFSTAKKGELFGFPDLVREILITTPSPDLEVNNEKTVFSSKKHNRHVTGLVLTNDGNVSLGRTKKREIRSLIYHYKNGHLDNDQIEKLIGTVAFARQVEPDFWRRIKLKYGLDDSFFKIKP
ncbi:retron St85 family RNA-directed DNA polymerase [Marinobacter flavimaris]|jgi:retron-type reverse transcriptase|uniref:retron St85 family RNA-directed DNA polymerase n=1 Tax=Marinobacter flavimaris TaxID=262076 RepID=UPI00386DE97B